MSYPLPWYQSEVWGETRRRELRFQFRLSIRHYSPAKEQGRCLRSLSLRLSCFRFLLSLVFRFWVLLSAVVADHGNETLAKLSKHQEKYFLAHAFILLTSSQNQYSCGFAGDLFSEKNEKNILRTIFENQICSLRRSRRRLLFRIILNIQNPCQDWNCRIHFACQLARKRKVKARSIFMQANDRKKDF